MNRKLSGKNFLFNKWIYSLFLISVFGMFENKATAQESITISFTNENLTGIIGKLEKVSGYSFAYQSDILPGNYKITHSFKAATISQILNTVLEGTGITFQILDKHIIIKKKEKRKKYTLSGYIEDSKAGQKLINVNVFDKENKNGTISNNSGFYQISLEEGVYNIVFSYIGTKKKEQLIVFDKDQQLNINLEPNVELSEVLVSDRHKEPLITEQSHIGKMHFSPAEMQKFPIIMAEPDLVKFAQMLPGVQSGMEANGAIYVRGGNSSHNLFLMDNVPLYNCFHLLGLFSVFNADMVGSTDIYKGAFPARFGGRLSSVLDIKTKDGNFKKLKGKATIGLIASKLSLEGPIFKDKTSFALSGRFGYYTFYGEFIPSSLKDGNSLDKFYFYDANVKVTHRLSDNSKIYATFYNGSDFGEMVSTYDNQFDNTRYFGKNVDGQNWHNLLGTIGWKGKINDWLFSNIQVATSNYNYSSYLNDSIFSGNLSQTTSSFQEDYLDNNILNRSIISTFTLKLAPRINMDLGYNYTLLTLNSQNGKKDHSLNTGENQLSYFKDTIINYYEYNTEEHRAFAELNISPFDKLNISAGLHTSYYSTEGYNNLSFQPRASASWEFTSGFILKGAYSQMVQHLHYLEATKIARASDLFVAAVDGAPSETSEHFSAGISILKSKNFNFHIEAYFKRMNNLINFKEGASYFSKNDTWVEKIVTGSGDSKGIELLVEKPQGKFTGWIGYTISKTNRQFKGINMGKAFPFRFEHRHHLNVIANYQLSKRWSLSANWLFHTGNKETIPSVFYWDPSKTFDKKMGNNDNSLKTFYNQKNGYINPNYHRLDLSVNYSKKNRIGNATWCLSVYNIYNRKNVYSSSYGEEWQNIIGTVSYNTRFINQHKLFGIIPSLSYTLSF